MGPLLKPPSENSHFHPTLCIRQPGWPRRGYLGSPQTPSLTGGSELLVITRLRIKQIFKWKFLLNNGLSIYYFNEGLLPNLLWKTSFFSYRKSNIFLRVHVSIINTKCQAKVILRFHKNEKKNQTTLNFIVKNLVLFNVVFSYKKKNN